MFLCDLCNYSVLLLCYLASVELKQPLKTARAEPNKDLASVSSPVSSLSGSFYRMWQAMRQEIKRLVAEFQFRNPVYDWGAAEKHIGASAVALLQKNAPYPAIFMDY